MNETSLFVIDENSKCVKCGKNGILKKDGKHFVLNYNCSCGGRIQVDWNKALSKKIEGE